MGRVSSLVWNSRLCAFPLERPVSLCRYPGLLNRQLLSKSALGILLF